MYVMSFAMFGETFFLVPYLNYLKYILKPVEAESDSAAIH